MTAQLYWDDVKVGVEIPRLIKHPTTRQLVKWAGASGDYYEVYYDKDFAQDKGLQGVIVHGRLKAAFLGQLLIDWIGERGSLKKLTCSYRAMDFPDLDIPPSLCLAETKFKEEAARIVNPKIKTYNRYLMTRGDPYCEGVFEEID